MWPNDYNDYNLHNIISHGGGGMGLCKKKYYNNTLLKMWIAPREIRQTCVIYLMVKYHCVVLGDR